MKKIIHRYSTLLASNDISGLQPQIQTLLDKEADVKCMSITHDKTGRVYALVVYEKEYNPCKD